MCLRESFYGRKFLRVPETQNKPKRDFSSCLEFEFGFFRFADSTLGPPVHPRLQENVTVFLWVQHPSLLFLTFVFTSAVSLGKVVFTLIHTRNCPGKPQSDLTAVVNSSTGIVWGLKTLLKGTVVVLMMFSHFYHLDLSCLSGATDIPVTSPLLQPLLTQNVVYPCSNTIG